MIDSEVELKARRFVAETGINTIPVDLNHYLKKVGARKIVVDDLAPGESGCTLQTKNGALIHLNGRDRTERQRFTLCHEVAHIELGLNSEHSYGAAWSYIRRPMGEILCDIYAAELLLPYRMFMAKAQHLPLTFETVEALRKEFEASREATASRLAATAKNACAYVLTEAGRVQHLVRSATIRETHAWIERGTPLQTRSAAYVLRGGGAVPGPTEVAGDVWFKGWEDVQLTESSLYLPEHDQTLTIISCEDSEDLESFKATTVETEDRSHGGLLQELDGNLPWPSGKKRR